MTACETVSDNRTITGTIDLEEDEWILKSDDGIYAVEYKYKNCLMTTTI
jgi:hypothetical protein